MTPTEMQVVSAPGLTIQAGGAAWSPQPVSAELYSGLGMISYFPSGSNGTVSLVMKPAAPLASLLQLLRVQVALGTCSEMGCHELYSLPTPDYLDAARSWRCHRRRRRRRRRRHRLQRRSGRFVSQRSLLCCYRRAASARTLHAPAARAPTAPPRPSSLRSRRTPRPCPFTGSTLSPKSMARSAPATTLSSIRQRRSSGIHTAPARSRLSVSKAWSTCARSRARRIRR